MVKITNRRSLDRQSVYDLGVASDDHNFLLANGLVASNCFNKSHSTAYAYVTYQTAYLKANYPVEYMTALLTASSNNQDKVEKYRDNAQKMGIEVKPPDINRSDLHFKPADNNILFGLSAVRNLGQGAIEQILDARKDGFFRTLADFCERVDLRVVNRRAMETLIYCGAFDEISTNRNQLLQDLDLIIPWCQKRAKDKASGQMNLFDLGGEQEEASDDFVHAPSAPPVPDFPTQERLKLEKEHLGFYVSDHPLKSIQNAAQVLSPINLRDLKDLKSRQFISAVVMVMGVRKITTKKGDPMAFLQLEDVSGQAEGVIFPSNFAEIYPLIEEDTRLIIWGKVDRRDEETMQIIVEDAEPVEQVQMVMVELSPQDIMSGANLNNLKAVLEQNHDRKARIPVIGVVSNHHDRQLVRFGQNFWVKDAQSAVISLENAKFKASTRSLLKTNVGPG
jgi:DNA polymerase-3 subunit alpha